MHYIEYVFLKGYRATITGDVIGLRGKPLKLHITRKLTYPYYTFAVRFPTTIRSILVHKLVAYQKYQGRAIKDGIHTRHLNGNSLDNSYVNIAIGTASDNSMDIPKKIRIQSATNASRYANPRTQKERFEIYSYLKRNVPYSKINRIFKISKGTLSFMKNKSEEYLNYIKNN